MATAIPYRWITGLDPQAQKEIERNFLHLQTEALVPVGASFFVACADAQPWEISRADLALTGTADDVLLQAFINANAGGTFYFSSGTVVLTAVVNLPSGTKLYGTALDQVGAPFYHITTFLCAIATGGSNAYALTVSANSVVVDGFAFTAAFTGSPPTTAVMLVGSTDCEWCVFRRLKFDGFQALFRPDTIAGMDWSVVEHIYSDTVSATLIDTGARGNLNSCFISDIQGGLTTDQAAIGGSLLLFANPTSTTEINSNHIVPQTTLPPSGTAGGDLAGTYPNPTLATGIVTAGAKGSASKSPTVTVDAKGRVILLSDTTISGAGIDSSALHSGDSAAGDLTGTYPNPTIKASVALMGAPTTAADPITALGLATKQYVDNLLAGLDAKDAVAYCAAAPLPANTYANGTLGVSATLTGNVNGPLVIDGVTILSTMLGERVLVPSEADGTHNGWYKITQVGVVAVSPYILTRAVGDDHAAVIAGGYLTGVHAPVGSLGTNDGKIFISLAPTPFVVGTDTVNFSAVGGTYSSSGGITLSGTNFTLASVADQRLLGNVSGGSAASIALTATQVITMLALVIGTNVEAWSSVLDAYAGGTQAAGGILSGTYPNPALSAQQDMLLHMGYYDYE